MSHKNSLKSLWKSLEIYLDGWQHVDQNDGDVRHSRSVATLSVENIGDEHSKGVGEVIVTGRRRQERGIVQVIVNLIQAVEIQRHLQ